MKMNTSLKKAMKSVLAVGLVLLFVLAFVPDAFAANQYNINIPQEQLSIQATAGNTDYPISMRIIVNEDRLFAAMNFTLRVTSGDPDALGLSYTLAGSDVSDATVIPVNQIGSRFPFAFYAATNRYSGCLPLCSQWSGRANLINKGQSPKSGAYCNTHT